MNAMTQPVQNAGWSAALELAFEARGGRTVLACNRHEGPLRVQRPFYPEAGGQCHVYILHPPGGIVAGDSLSIQARFAAGSHGLLTTPSAGRVYKSNHQRLPQSQTVQLDVDSGGFCEWLPQENILFNAAQAHNRTQVELAPGSRFIGWEITCLGRPASAHWFDEGALTQTFSLHQNGVPLLCERSHFTGGSALLQAAWGLQGYATVGTLVCVSRDTDLLQALKLACASACDGVNAGQSGPPALKVAVTRLPELLVVRGLAHNAAPLRNFFIDCWRLMRLHLLQSEPVAPRIWFT